MRVHPSSATEALGGGHATALHDVGDPDGREVDFLVTVNRKPGLAVEANLSATRVDPSLVNSRERRRIPWFYQVTRPCTRDFVEDGARAEPERRFLEALAGGRESAETARPGRGIASGSQPG